MRDLASECSSVGMRPRTDTQTDTHACDQYTFASSTTHAKCNDDGDDDGCYH